MFLGLIPVFWVLTYQMIWENKGMLFGILILVIYDKIKDTLKPYTNNSKEPADAEPAHKQETKPAEA